MFSYKKLKELRLEKGVSQSYIAQELGISKMSYSYWESGKTQPNEQHRAQLASLLEVDSAAFESEYDIVHQYLRLTSLNQKKLSHYADQLLASQIFHHYPIRVLSDVALSAGLGESLFDEQESQLVFSDQDYHYDVAAFIKGNSMEPKFLDGEVALIQKTGFDHNGAVYALSYQGQTFIKKVYREKDRLRLVSINPSYPDWYIESEEDYRIVGKVTASFMPIKEDYDLH